MRYSTDSCTNSGRRETQAVTRGEKRSALRAPATSCIITVHGQRLSVSELAVRAKAFSLVVLPCSHHLRGIVQLHCARHTDRKTPVNTFQGHSGYCR